MALVIDDNFLAMISDIDYYNFYQQQKMFLLYSEK